MPGLSEPRKGSDEKSASSSTAERGGSSRSAATRNAGNITMSRCWRTYKASGKFFSANTSAAARRWKMCSGRFVNWRAEGRGIKNVNGGHNSDRHSKRNWLLRDESFTFSDCGENLCRYLGVSLYDRLRGMARCQRSDPDALRVDAPRSQLKDDYQGSIH
jgi:hypothetical protein